MPEIIVTEVMIEAGVNASYGVGSQIAEMSMQELQAARREMVQEVFRAMMAAAPKLRTWKAIGRYTRAEFTVRESMAARVDGGYPDGSHMFCHWESPEAFLEEYPDAVEVTEGGDGI